jgi:hypothetical protein
VAEQALTQILVMAHQRPLDRRLAASVKGHDLVSNQTVRFCFAICLTQLLGPGRHREHFNLPRRVIDVAIRPPCIAPDRVRIPRSWEAAARNAAMSSELTVYSGERPHGRRDDQQTGGRRRRPAQPRAEPKKQRGTEHPSDAQASE